MESSRPHSRVIVIAGIYRSASTYLYNVVRVLYKHAGRDVWGGGRDAFMGTDGTEADVYVVKTHKWFEPLAKYADDILTSKRAVKKSWESFKRFKPDEDCPWQATRQWLDWYMSWKGCDNHRYTMYFEDFMGEDGPWNALKDVAHVLDLDNLNLERCMKHLRSELAPPKNETKNPETLVFSNHYTERDYEDDILPRMRVPERDKA